MTEQQLRTISVDDLFSSGKISRKTYYVLSKARLRTVFDLKRYRSGLPRLFKNNLNGTREVNNVLDEMDNADKFPEMSTSLFPTPEPDLSRGELLLERLGDEQMELLELVYKRFIDKLKKTRERVSTHLANALNQIPVSHFVRDYLFEDEERILMLSEIGEASLPFLATLKEELTTIIDGMDNSDVPLQFKILQFKAEGALDNDAFVLHYYVNHGYLPVLYLIQEYIIGNKSMQTFKAFLNRYDIFDGKVQLDTTEIKRSTFTITSYSNSIYDALFTIGASVDVFGHFLGKLMIGKEFDNGLSELFEGCYLDKEDERIATIIEEQQLLMTPMCVVALLGKILSNHFSCLGGYTRSFGTALEGRWRHAYLVDNQLAEAIDFERELWLFRDSVVKDSTDYFVFDIEEYVSDRMNTIGFQGNVDEVAYIMKNIIVGELQLEFDEEGNVIIPKVKDKALADRLYYLLDKRKQPMSLDELTDKINSGDGRRYVKASVSLALNKDSRFQVNGKKGLYALAVWELPYFDTNANIVYSVLDEADRPMKSEEIVHIISSCPYNSQFSRNDLSSVFSFGKDKFVKLGQGYYGLAGREYSEEKLLVTKNPFDVEMDSMMEFMDKNGKVPSRNGGKDEASMRGWFDRKRKQFDGDNTWKEEKRASFSKLVEKFDQLVADEKKALPEVKQPLSLFPDIDSSETVPANDAPMVNDVFEPTVEVAPGNLPNTEILEKEQDAIKEDTNLDSSQEVSNNDDPENIILEDGKNQLTEHTETVQQMQDTSIDGENESRWMMMLDEIWKFVKLNHREPLAMFTVEVEFAEWLNAQKKALRQGILSDNQRSELMKLRDFLW